MFLPHVTEDRGWSALLWVIRHRLQRRIVDLEGSGGGLRKTTNNLRQDSRCLAEIRT
jgi:hypothetical protein